MIRNYLLTAWRNLLSNKMNAFINIAGLTVAFTVCILLFLMVHFEFSFDTMHKNGDHLFMVYDVSHTADGDERSTSMSFPAAPAFKSEVPGIIKTTSYMWGGQGVRYKGKELEKGILLVDNDFLSMFSFPVISGNRSTPLAGLGDVVLSRATAEALMGKEDPIGKTIALKVSGVWKDLVVSSVIEDAPENSSIRPYILIRIENHPNYAEQKDNWNNQHHFVFAQTSPAVSRQQVEKAMRSVVKRHNLGDVDYMKLKGYRKDSNGDMFAMKLAPYTGLHFDNEIGFGSTVSKSYLYILVLIAIVVLVIACFNFINLNVARAFTRAREVGVRKTIGAGRGQIFFQLWTESFLLFAFAVILAIGLSMLALKPFNALFVEKLAIGAMMQPMIILSILAGTILVSFLAGGYPAWIVSRFNTVEVLKGKVSVRRSGFVRNGLITFQFVMACLLICSTIVIYRQFEYMRTAPLGYEQESVISIPVKNSENAQQYISKMRTRLSSQPQILSITGSSANIGIGEDHSQSNTAIGFTYNGRSIQTEMLTVDFDYLETLGIKPLAGRGFSREYATDTSSKVDNVVVTESMAKEFLEKNVVGLSLSSDTSAPNWHIVGVIPDIHLHSMHEKTRPLTFTMAKQTSRLGYILVRTRTPNPLQAMQIVKDAYHAIEPDNATNPSYLSENTSRWYAKEQRLSTIFFSAAAIAVVLSCLGLFAIVSLVIGLRRKEIGVRKVLGASIGGIATLLSKDFVRLVLLACVIATPIGWYFLNGWLQDFVYRISISWWIFPLAGLVALAIALGTISILTIRASLANPVKNLRTE